MLHMHIKLGTIRVQTHIEADSCLTATAGMDPDENQNPTFFFIIIFIAKKTKHEYLNLNKYMGFLLKLLYSRLN